MRVFIFLTLAVVAVYGKGYGYGGHGHGHWHHHKMPFGPGPGFGSFGAMGGAGSVGIGGKSFVDFRGPAGFGPRMMPPPPPPPMPTFEMSSGYLPPPPPSGPLLPPGPPPPGPGPMYDFGGYQEIYPPMGPQYYDTGYYYSQPGPGIGGTAGIQMAPEPVPLQTAAVQPPPTNFLAQPQVFPNAPMGGAGAVQSNFIGGGQPADAGLFTAQNGMLPAAPPLAGQAFGAPGAFPGINQINGAGAALSQQLPGAQTMNVMNAINKKK